jgi:hypothetical protein
MKTLLIEETIKKYLGEDEKVLLADGLESAFIGIGRQFNYPIAIYSKKKAIKAIRASSMPRMSEEDAVEYFDYNVAQSFVGDQTPVFLEDE